VVVACLTLTIQQVWYFTKINYAVCDMNRNQIVVTLIRNCDAAVINRFIVIICLETNLVSGT